MVDTRMEIFAIKSNEFPLVLVSEHEWIDPFVNIRIRRNTEVLRITILNNDFDLEKWPVVYCHVRWLNEDKTIPDSVFISKEISWDFSIAPIYDWEHFYNKGERILFLEKSNESEDETMFENYQIVDIEFGELNPVALKTAVKEIAKTLDGVSIEKEGGETYLVKDGTAVLLEGKEFQAQVQKYVVGKTMAELKKSPAMHKIITKLGLISKCTLQKSDEGIADIFGS